MPLRQHILVPPMLVLAIASSLAAQTVVVRGTVHDASGAAIADAKVTIRSGANESSTQSDSRGDFSIPGVPGNVGTIEVSSRGFRTIRQQWGTGAGSEITTNIVLEPASAGEQITVSATRTEVRLSEAPGSTVLLSTPDVAASPALRLDDVLRQVPGFSLFRRSGSRTANATNQGVSLRGLGGTAASRALVLEDGLPLVDAFGGWVYWGRVPREAVASVEVFRGGASNLYGSDALGGVVQFITRQPQRPTLALETSYGSERTPDLSLWTGTRFRKWDVSVASEMFRTDGYILVPTWQRGSVDSEANSKNAAVELDLGRQVGTNGRIFVRGNYFTEFRNNGTPIQTNDTQMVEGALGCDQQFGDRDSLTLRTYGLVQSYHQRFSSVAPDRNSESLTNRQYVPEQVVGGTAQWTHLLGTHQTLIGGADLMEVMGASDEQVFSTGVHTRNNAAGGRQRIFGLYGQDIMHFRGWTFILGARVDDWNNFDASNICTPVSGTCTVPSQLFPSRSDLAFSPRLSVLRSLTRNVSVTGSVYRAFRAPTLNELYRSFRLGNVLTLNNPELSAERLTGAEAGLNISSFNRKLDLRGTFFWSDIVNPVENVTIDPTASPVLRQKQNVGKIRSRGVELDGAFRVNQHIQVTAGYEFTDATIVSYTVPPGAVSLLGNNVAQVPHHVFTWQARYWNPSRLMFSVEGRYVGNQFDDDQNLYPLDHFYTMNLQIGNNLTRNLEVFAASENILNVRYKIANTPTATGSLFNIGPPILYRIGLRLNFPAENH